ncbi:hypothetical protein POM88_025114 [Heracleum sosnowskyi]|uniref:F-box domain-containing protein n=1 Tax=Heracleum sosnowskyi TaxID=360622 RepID=A0AAD8I6E9_9APIA|nr:hypothetical protein POM88_025114 [Heracleum sosnowskyi]
MEDQRMNKKARSEDEDKISNLSDDVIHQIMSLLDTRTAVQTSILSKRWKLVWTTLPFLSFDGLVKGCKKESKFLKHVFSSRNHQCLILNLDLYPTHGLSLGRTNKFVKYAIAHNVVRLNVQPDEYCSLSVFNSNSLKELKLTMRFKSEEVMRPHCWNLPNLTTLICECTNYHHNVPRQRYKLPRSCLIHLSALTNLRLSRCELPDLISLPSLTTLYLESCNFPNTVWDFPALSTVELVAVVLPRNMRDYFLALASLRNLTIDLGSWHPGCCEISSARLMNLKIIYPQSEAKIMVQAPKLRNFEAVGFFPMTFGGSELENVDIKFWDCTRYSCESQFWRTNPLFETMFPLLGSTKILSLDLLTLQALSEHSAILEDLDSPFYNLKYIKLPHGCEESCISSSVRQYLLGGSPNATFVKSSSQMQKVNYKICRLFMPMQCLSAESFRNMGTSLAAMLVTMIKKARMEDEDRISKLSDDALHGYFFRSLNQRSL